MKLTPIQLLLLLIAFGLFLLGYWIWAFSVDDSDHDIMADDDQKEIEELEEELSK